MSLQNVLAPSIAGLPAELSLLFLASILGLVQCALAGRVNNRQRGIQWNLGARDGEPPPVSPLAGRLERARANFMETFAFFAVAVLMAAVTGRHGPATLLGCVLYFWARLVYVPLYAFGVFGVRTLVWLAALAGILAVYAGIVWPNLFPPL